MSNGMNHKLTYILQISKSMKSKHSGFCALIEVFPDSTVGCFQTAAVLRRCFVSSKLQAAIVLFSKLQAKPARASVASKVTLDGATAVQPFKKPTNKQYGLQFSTCLYTYVDWTSLYYLEWCRCNSLFIDSNVSLDSRYIIHIILQIYCSVVTVKATIVTYDNGIYLFYCQHGRGYLSFLEGGWKCFGRMTLAWPPELNGFPQLLPPTCRGATRKS